MPIPTTVIKAPRMTNKPLTRRSPVVMSQTDKNFSNIDAHVEDGKQLGAIVFPAGSIYNAVLDFSQQIGWNIQKSGRISINRIVQTGTLTKPNTPRAIPLRMKNSAII